jgi:16S rRNA (cytidine1402-2'-O)-methyltransferase
MPGTLYVVATPIGNLEDITLRALRVLREVDVIACEDTRRTRVLLARHQVATATVSYHEHNHRTRGPELVRRLCAGGSVALVTDAGTPGLSDPGFRLVRQARAAGVPVVPVPGPSAVAAALSASGVPADRFVFEGFLPARPGRRLSRLRELAALEMTLVLYESPHRILATLEALAEVFGDREIVVARELTKQFEEIVAAPAEVHRVRLADTGGARGEFTVVVPARPAPPAGQAYTAGER